MFFPSGRWENKLQQIIRWSEWIIAWIYVPGVTPQADDGCTIVDMHVFADEAIGRSRKYCNRECRSKAVNTSVSRDKTTMFFQHTAATVMYNHRISQAGRNPWGSLSPTPWNTCSLCLVAEIERDHILVGDVFS